MRFIVRELRWVLIITAACTTFLFLRELTIFLVFRNVVMSCVDQDGAAREVVDDCSYLLRNSRVKTGHDRILQSRANAYSKLGETDAALADAEAVVELRPSDAVAVARRAYFKSALGLVAEAAEDFEAALEMGSDTVSVLRWRAEAASLREDHAAALADYEKASALEPDNAEIVFLRSKLQNKLGNNRLFLELMAQAVRLDPDNDVYRYSVGRYHLNLGDNCATAIAALEAAVKEAESVLSALSLVMIYFHAGEQEKAKFYSQYVAKKTATEELTQTSSFSLILYRIYNWHYPAYSFERMALIKIYAALGPLDLALTELDILLKNGGFVASRYLRNRLNELGYPAASSSRDDLRAAFVAFAKARSAEFGAHISGPTAEPNACWG